MLCFYASKGGVGCSTAAVSTALLSARCTDTLLVDLKGDLLNILGVSSDGPGLADWMNADTALPDTLARLEVAVTDRLTVLPLGRPGLVEDRSSDTARLDRRAERVRVLASLLQFEDRQVVVDLGVPDAAFSAVLAAASRSLLVMRACYLAVKAAALVPPPDEVVLITEVGRYFRPGDVEAAIAAPVDVVISRDIDVARRIDAGLLVARLPKSLRPLGALL